MKLARACLLVFLFAGPLPALAAVAVAAGDALRRAAADGDVAAVTRLLDAGTPVSAANAYGGTALSFACDHGRLEVVRLLLERGADPNGADTFYHATPLSWAAQRGNVEIARLLLEKGATDEADALMTAVFGEQPALVELILGRGKVAAAGLSQALVAAQQTANAAIVAQLEKAGAKPPPAADFAVPSAVLASYVGRYADEGGVERLVTLVEGRLTLTTASGQVLTLGALDTVTFRPDGTVGLTLVFGLIDGRVATLTIVQDDVRRVLRRLEAKP